jgi:hypothetical protein
MTKRFGRVRRGGRAEAVRAARRLSAIAALIALVAYSIFGTLSPCSVLRDTARRFDGLAAVLPDSILDQMIEAQYGELSPGRCIAIILNHQKTPVAVSSRGR